MTPKFRVWDSVEKKFVEHFFITDNGLICNMEKPTSDSKLLIPIEKSELILMQSTGLKDKNGKEIFEGDILEIQDEGEVLGNAKLTWDNEQAVFMIEAISVDDIAPFHEILSDESYSYRVVGNIYENKELLDA
ncbi:phage protein [Streptococcus pseudopneumoniae]|uniref:YopX family protein n=1 Tax=Streptococcus pseudopneumoniae TaxID=257758 RepID=UPI0005E42729|nr:YopX family protein [Streptococcus pseudopneumoniae]CJY63349.1 phage protein [Streptococcus pseudopneumoniae]COC59721.1 phage protein [Streptococcus pseudopneumoniae]CON48147.1 phage protein [Streptococcus pseudopneumoniae]